MRSYTRTGIYRYASIAIVTVALLAVFFMPAKAYAVDNGIPSGYKPTKYNNIPHVQMKDIFSTETVEVSGIKVNADRYFNSSEDTVHFRIFNTTTQETEYEVDTVKDGSDNYLPSLNLKKKHDYIFSVEDAYYRGDNKYVQIRAGNDATSSEGPGAYDYITTSLKYSKVNEINVKCRGSKCSDPYDDNRYNTGSKPVYVYYKGKKMSGIKFRLVSDLETLTTTTGSDGKLNVRLIEGVTYMVYVVSDKFIIDPFPIVVKDKTEYGEGLYCYNHTNCLMVKRIDLYDKNETDFDGYERITSVRSLKGRTTVSGINFRNQLIIDRVLDTKLSALSGKKYEVIDVVAVNPRRWERSKLLGTNFTIRRRLPAGTGVANTYHLINGKLKKTGFRQSKCNEVSITSSSLSLYPVVIVFGSGGNNIHSWDAGTVTKKPTLKSVGTKTFKCKICKKTRTEAVPKLSKAKDGTAAGEGASFEYTDAAVTASRSDEGPSGTSFAKLKLRSDKQTNNSAYLKWAKAKSAVKYVVYGNECGKKNRLKKLATTKNNRFNVKKINRKLKKGKYYKFMVVALDKNNKVVSSSNVVHVATKGGKIGNHKSVKVTKKVVANAGKLKTGKSLKLNAKAVAASKRLKVKKHRALKYESGNPKIATVSKKGIVKAKKKGTCYVYAYAQNGVFTKVKVTVN